MKETWQERLNRFEATPPARVWDRLEESLEQDPATVAERLHAWEAAPPVGLWDRIESQLDATEQKPAADEVPVLNMPRRRRTFFAYAAAAALLGVLLIGTALLLNRKQEPSVARTEQPPIQKQQASPEPFHTADPAPTHEDAEVATSSSTDQPDAGVATSKGSDGTVPTMRRQPDVAVASTRNNTFAAASPANTHNPVGHAALDEDRYLVRAYNNGSTVRFSKKVSAVVDCAEHSTGFTQSLCKVSIGAVQERMTSIVSTDFGGLIDRLQDLEKTR